MDAGATFAQSNRASNVGFAGPAFSFTADPFRTRRIGDGSYWTKHRLPMDHTGPEGPRQRSACRSAEIYRALHTAARLAGALHRLENEERAQEPVWAERARIGQRLAH